MPSGSITTVRRIGRHTWMMAQRLLHAPLGFLVAEYIAQTLRRRLLGVVVVHAFDRRARVGRGAALFVADADGVVEHMHLAGAGVLFDQFRAFGIVDAFALVLACKVLHLRLVGDKHKAVGVELECIAQRPAVADFHHVLLVLRRVGLVLHLRPVDVVHRRRTGIDDVVHLGLNGVGDRLFGHECHGASPAFFAALHSGFYLDRHSGTRGAADAEFGGKHADRGWICGFQPLARKKPPARCTGGSSLGRLSKEVGSGAITAW